MGRKRSTKAEIVKVAWKLFNEKGYEETTIDEIIAGSNTSKGSFYHYFNSKDELLSSLSELFDVKYEEEMANLDPEMNSYDKLLYLLLRARHDPGRGAGGASGLPLRVAGGDEGIEASAGSEPVLLPDDQYSRGGRTAQGTDPQRYDVF